ncbi:hypothetical protein JFK97_15575 [Chromobacterium phragmitis]|nr:hypothetical protein [Chromobacterium amazonense]MBM2885817.1 hypothetical protein [Chromobacterium amazonense]
MAQTVIRGAIHKHALIPNLSTTRSSGQCLSRASRSHLALKPFIHSHSKW